MKLFMHESNSSLLAKNNDELKQWIYPMFFSTKAGANRILIVNSISVEPKKIRTIANETKMSYYHVKYNVGLLEKKGFLIKTDKEYLISQKFLDSYYILNNITNQTQKLNRIST